MLTTATFTTPVEISTTGQTTTLTVGDGTASGPLNEVGSLPVFTSIGGSVPALQGTFLVRESGNALSLTPTTPSGQPEASPLTLESVSGQSAPFTLTLTNGMSLQLTATVTATGVLVVTAPDTAGSVDVQQAILMGAQVVRQALNIELNSLASALFVRQ